jgi:hypothetical protein
MTLTKNAINIYHFFKMVLEDLNEDLYDVQPEIKCKTPNGNLIYDGICVYSYGVKILHYEDNEFIINAEPLPEDKKKLRTKILKHLTELIKTLGIQKYENYTVKLNTNNNYQFDWLLENIKISKLVYKQECSIDLEEYNTLINTECGHTFYDKNLYTWLKIKDNCPLCRTKLLNNKIPFYSKKFITAYFLQ